MATRALLRLSGNGRGWNFTFNAAGMGFTRDDLLHRDYYWPDKGTILEWEGDLSNQMLDRENGFDMLRCIRWCAMKLGHADQIKTCQILEIDIRRVVPLEIRRYRDILSWLLSRYLFLLY